MAETTEISWAHSTFNPWIGCTNVSPGCDHCYAEALDKRWGGDHWGPGKARRRTSAANWKEPLKWNRKAKESDQPWRVFCAKYREAAIAYRARKIGDAEFLAARAELDAANKAHDVAMAVEAANGQG